ncbi:MAG: VWA domain-containing protein, partial [Bdellovibrionales bacterium]|nr:VWA domain-containing protein [Bdellovibrionales bacterium]
MTFLHPEHLIYAVSLTGSALAALLYFFTRTSSTAGVGVGFSLILRFLVVLLLSLAALGLYTEKILDTSRILVLVDRSNSLSKDYLSQIEAKIANLAGNSIEISAVSFGANSLDLKEDLHSALTADLSGLDPTDTNLERALAETLTRDTANVVLISDGFETRGDTSEVLPLLARTGVRVFPLLGETTSLESPRFEISQVDAALLGAVGEKLEISIALNNTTRSKQAGSLSLSQNGEKISSRRVSLDPSQESSFSELSPILDDKIQQIEIELLPDDKQLPSSKRTVFLAGETREKVLVLSGAASDDRFLSKALQNQAFQVEQVTAESRLLELPKLSKYSAVVFNNVSRSQLPFASDAAVEEYVRNGGGFMMIGGERSFGLGDYIGSNIEKVLPVEMVPPHKQKKRLNVAVELILDKSKSMADYRKLDFAKEAAREVIRNLKDDDYIGVIGFDSAPFEVVRLALLKENRQHALERVGRLYPAQKTNLLPAINEGRRRLESAQAGRKHMIILTDGKLPDAGPYYLSMLKEMRFLGITVSTVMLGTEADFGFLRSMADAGGGAFYQTNDPRTLPRIFLSDVKVSGGEQTIKEQKSYNVRRGPAGVVSTAIESFPPLRGYVQTRPRQKSALELVALNVDKAEPLLASWAYGVGHAIAFTSDANGRWSNFWVSWPRYQKFWSDMIGALNPQQSSDAIKFELRHHLQNDRLVFDLILYSEVEGQKLTATLQLPSGKQEA